MNYDKLSREMSYILRHKPEEYDIVLDEEGWTSVDRLLSGLQKKPKWAHIQAPDIEKVVSTDNKGRYQLVAGRIRAVHGHSKSQGIKHTPKEPPTILYHGTTNHAYEAILREGLKPQSRQHVHLSTSKELAQSVGKRRDSNPLILRVNSLEAYRDGIVFFESQSGIWLAEYIATKYIGKD